MIRLLIVVLFALVLSACTEPRERMMPDNIAQWEADKDFQSALAALTLEEQNLLSTYLIRVEADQLAGKAPPRNMTIGEAISEQLIWVDQWQERRQLQNARKLAAIKYKRDYLSRVEVVGFEVLEQAAIQGAGAQKIFCGLIVNKGDKPLCDVQLTVYFLDKYGYEISEVIYNPLQVQTDSEIAGNSTLQPNEKIEFNYQFSGDLPDNWTGMASAFVTDIAFAEESVAIEN